jgi:hypothetical protein
MTTSPSHPAANSGGSVQSPLPGQAAVDVAPFAARRTWTTPQDYEIWWEDPRDLCQVVVQFAEDPVRRTGSQQPPDLQYWQQSWPKIRVPKGETVGSGRSGWLAIDDWTNGRWQQADCEVNTQGNTHTYTFRPLNSREFPNEADFPATFRRTIKLRLHFEFPAGGSVEVEDPLQRAVRAFTDSAWRETGVAIEWKSPSGEPENWDGHLEVFNGYLAAIGPLRGDVALSGEAAWRSAVAGSATGGIRATIRHAHNEDANSYDRTIVTVRRHSPGTGPEQQSFSFLVDDVLSGTPVYVRDYGALVSREDAGVRLATFEAAWAQGHEKTLYERIRDLPEQSWEQAWAGMPAKKRHIYYVLGCEGSRQKFGVDPNGDIFLGENFIRRVPGKDTPRLGWSGRELRYGFGFPGSGPADRFLLEGYLPVLRTSWTEEDLCFQQEAYATWLPSDTPSEPMSGDDTVVAMVRIRLTNLGDEPRTARLFLSSTIDGGAPAELTEREGLIYAKEPADQGTPAQPQGGTGEQRLCYLFDTNGAGVLRPGDGGLAYEVSLPGKSAHAVYARIPFITQFRPYELTRLRRLRHVDERKRVAAFWRRRIGTGAQIETPNETLNNFYRTHLMHMLVINDREPGADRNVARCGGFHYGSFPDEGCMVISDLDRRGYTAEAERCLDLYVRYQGTVPLPGNYSSADGVFYGSGGYEVAGYNRNQGWVLWCLAEHYRYTRDRAWLERVAPALVKGCDWISRERRATMVGAERPLQRDDQGRQPIQYGFLPAGSLEDVTDYWTWLSTNAYAYLGLRSAAAVLAEIGHREAARLQGDAEAYGRDLRAGFFEAAARSPVVRLRNGTWVPHFPPRQERRGRDFGWLREVLEGAVHLIYCGIIAPDEPAARWIIEDYEDNLFLSDGYGYPAPDFERQWFGWGGFSMQPNLLIFPSLYLWRDEPKHYLRAYFNPFASAFYPDVLMLTEHALPTLADWTGDHFKTSDEANSTFWLRQMFLAERGNELFVGQAIPRAWLEDGKRMRVDRALTHFGVTSLEIVSQVETGYIVVKLDPPRRNPPERINLRVRHPGRKPIRQVWVNGLPHHDLDIEKEVIYLRGASEPLDVRVSY